MTAPSLAQTTPAIGQTAPVSVKVNRKDAGQLKGYDIEIILDVSGSMSGEIDGQQKIDIAKSAIQETLNEIPQTARLAFRAYGHKEVPENQKCENSELLIPFGARAQDIVRAMRPLVPRGLTPIEYSLRAAWNDFPTVTEFGKMIILVSDGQETCQGDPCAAVRDLQQNGINVQVNTIGFDVDKNAENQLRCIAKATGGEYRNATNAEDLLKGLKELASRAKLEYETTAGEIKPGTGFETAPFIKPGEFKTNILSDEIHFYKLEVEKGQNLIIVYRFRPERAIDGIAFCKMNLNLFDKYKRRIGRDSEQALADEAEFKDGSYEGLVKKTGTIFLEINREPSHHGNARSKFDKVPINYELGVYLEDAETK